MKKFEFTPRQQPATSTIKPFSGSNFYNLYKDSDFLRSSDNIETILSKGHELRQMLKTVPPGQTVEVKGMNLERNAPLLVKNTVGANIAVEDFEFTNNRLTGLVAAFAFDNRSRFPVIKSSEAQVLGLIWDHADADKCKIYLSAVTGTEHFYEQFSFWPLVCAFRKFQLGKLKPELVLKVAKIKNNNGVRLGTDFKNNFATVKHLWNYFPNSNLMELIGILDEAPVNIKRAFEDE